MRTALRTVCLAALALLLAGCTTSPPAPAGQPLLGEAAVFSTQATVVAAEYAMRELTLEIPNVPGDNFFDVARLRVGDKVKTTFARALLVDITPRPAG